LTLNCIVVRMYPSDATYEAALEGSLRAHDASVDDDITRMLETLQPLVALDVRRVQRDKSEAIRMFTPLSMSNACMHVCIVSLTSLYADNVSAQHAIDDAHHDVDDDDSVMHDDDNNDAVATLSSPPFQRIFTAHCVLHRCLATMRASPAAATCIGALLSCLCLLT